MWELIVQLPREASRCPCEAAQPHVPRHQREAQRALAAAVAEVGAGKVSSSTTTIGMCRAAVAPDGYVFTSTVDGSKPLHPDTITQGFQKLRSRAGLTSVSLHDLHHLHATQFLAAGVPVRTVSGRLGHANAATTLNVYAHFLEASDREAADVIAGLLERSPPGAAAASSVPPSMNENDDRTWRVTSPRERRLVLSEAVPRQVAPDCRRSRLCGTGILP